MPYFLLEWQSLWPLFFSRQSKVDGERISCGDPVGNRLLILRADAIEERPCIMAKGVNLEVYREQIEWDENYAPSEELFETRQINVIDPLRHNCYPDDVSVLIASEGLEIEQVWARLQRIGDECLEAMLLNEPDQDFPVHAGDTLHMKLARSEDGNPLLVAEF